MPSAAKSVGSSSSAASSDASESRAGKWTREAEKKAVQEIEREDARRQELKKKRKEEEQKAVEAERTRVRAEIERKVRDKHWQASNAEFQAKVTQMREEREQLHQNQGPESNAKIRDLNHPVPRIRDPNELTAKFGYTIVYNKMFEGAYWKMLQAKKRDDPDHLFALFVIDASKVGSAAATADPFPRTDRLCRLRLLRRRRSTS